ncbi:peptidoglycan editing factor PgeF [Pseudomonas syringae]|uniref:Purine nucleoside phosphorylase n=1 Tax=Pseudomonas syringae TaxID=317 RepID=A0A9Q4A7M1_PSESX|nr:peptidoglycan editing factor PgeF [Pseudomonas syringae]MCF5468763.1 peptidoglycan editing factor PgeF [Pseudomonas syringae]MCF5472498.1 peptidoglycan editing factor PgeF [Pseudomonas syringae]MCF5481648.1 peptidoglycan editing factor PgeF [Pseudomonas syringae]MCF5486542.1 peptidoglycan editing factor PgeF [Pseudomonas syringae]MCF5493906.1 peptidoglycan editing factor PgeF [Pseudomonas syringae]
MNDWLIPDWPAPAQIKSCVTTRSGGASLAPFDSFNLGDHVDDSPEAVASNRLRLTTHLNVQPAWLRQVHGVNVAHADPSRVVEADASWTSSPGVACTIMTADCLPALFCRRDGTRVAAAHAGWRGLAAGVLEATADSLQSDPQDILVWLGPAIGQRSFEVGPEVREAFTDSHPQTAEAFVASSNPDRFMADIYTLARLRLAAHGISAVYGGGLDTFTDSRFFSYRRAARTGRFASLIWIEHA